MAGNKRLRRAVLSETAKKKKKEDDKLRSATRVTLTDQKERWDGLKDVLQMRSDHEVAKILLDSYYRVNCRHANCESSKDDKSQIHQQLAKMTSCQCLSLIPGSSHNPSAASGDGRDPAQYYITANSAVDATNDHSSYAATPLDMSCDTIFQVTVMLNLESDWKCPVVVSLTNATVSSSEVTGSTSHKVKVINDQTVEVTSLINHNPGSDIIVPGNSFCVPASGFGGTGSGITLSPDLPSDTTLTSEVKVELTDTASEEGDHDTFTECDDTDASEDNVVIQKDNAKDDPDWDPDGGGDIADVPGDPESSDSESLSDEELDYTEKAWKCQACSFGCNTQINLKGHVTKVHYEEASLSGLRMCPQCGKVEDSIELLREHRQVVHEFDKTEQHRCPLCRKMFTTYCQYRTHVAGHKHKHKCDTCGRAFLMPKCLKLHVIRTHEVSSQLKPKKMICEICGHQSDHKRQLEEHQAMTHGVDFGKRFACAECEEVFSTKKQLNHHTKRHHTSSLDHTCDICNRVFKRALSLRTHLENVHWHTNRQKCPHCQKEFASKKRLDSHVNIKHMNVRQLACPWPGCVKSFGKRKHLQVHMRIHNDEKPLGCPHCDFRARQRHALDYHLERHHKDLPTAQKKNDNQHCEQTSTEHPASEGNNEEQTASDHTDEYQITPEQTDSNDSDD